MSGPRLGSLFTGYGGLDMAARAVLGGGTAVWHCDIKPAARVLLAHRHPEVANLGDMTAVDWAQVEPVDVLTFGWPCQPHSSAGKRLGEADPRALWPHVARAVGALRPRILFGENVARVASNGELRRVVRALADLGYVGAWRCVTAAEIGAPHKRARLALVAVRADAAADPGGCGLPGHPERDRGPLGGPGAPSLGLDAVRCGARGPDRLLKTPTANLGSNGGSQHPDKRKAGGHGPTLADEVEWLLPTPSASSYGTNQGGAAGRVGPVRESLDTMARRDRLRDWGRYTAAVQRWESVLGHSAPAPTMESPKRGGKPILAPAFVEWMMGLPTGWVTEVPGLSRAQQLSMLGDGVVPQQLAHGYRLALAALFRVAVAA